MTESVRRLPDGPTQGSLLVKNRLVRETLVRLLRKRSDSGVVGQGNSTEAEEELPRISITDRFFPMIRG